MNIALIRPSIELKDKVIEYWDEFYSNGENFIDDTKDYEQKETYEDWLTRVTNDTSEKTVSKDWVVTDTFFAIRKSDNKIIGMTELRHSTDEIIKDFGQVGYDVRPSERNKGYATEMLKMLIVVAKEAQMNELYISVKKTNLPSIKVITNNDGIFEKSFEYYNQIVYVYKILL
ncbi:GNAT family N-acetyltransferase [Sedimentibacter sp. zth1]|uniref:GNAT family N-acetyltransferase n=1 Tax=Sedimentibacter sp. zth1 TaxID=2816908 RepID=UPI001A90D18C|nr:GNAT family N-acetyltransferase [Sedimentibacter sp. zth1]QSX07221.1 GNAT family N-acetyltransferase [Sedimentibacter sp. zth1]